MFRMLGISLHPALCALLGIALAAFGFGTQRPGLAAVGGILVVWAVVGALGRSRSERAKDDTTDRYVR